MLCESLNGRNNMMKNNYSLIFDREKFNKFYIFLLDNNPYMDLTKLEKMIMKLELENVDKKFKNDKNIIEIGLSLNNKSTLYILYVLNKYHFNYEIRKTI